MTSIIKFLTILLLLYAVTFIINYEIQSYDFAQYIQQLESNH